MNVRGRLRSIESQIIMPTSLLMRKVVLTLSALVIVGILLAAGLGWGDPRHLRAVAYLLLALYTRVIVANFHAGVNYHPGYKHKESLNGWALAILAALTLGNDALLDLEARLGVPLLAWTPWLWITILWVGQLSLMDFVIRRNNDPDNIVIKTAEGLVQVPEQRTRERLAEYLAGWLRHGLISAEKRELLREGIGVPPSSVWAEELREQLRLRRENAARRDTIAAEVEVRAMLEGE